MKTYNNIYILYIYIIIYDLENMDGGMKTLESTGSDSDKGDNNSAQQYGTMTLSSRGKIKRDMAGKKLTNSKQSRAAKQLAIIPASKMGSGCCSLSASHKNEKQCRLQCTVYE